MLLGLVGALAVSPIYWLLVPRRARKDTLALASVVGLGLYDSWLPIVALSLVLLLFGASRLIAVSDRARNRRILLCGFTILVLLFAYNKLADRGQMIGVLATQGSLVFLGISYFVLKAAAILIETARDARNHPGLLSLGRWMVFLPIFPSGPIEEFKHFDAQEPAVDHTRILRGLERILFGCVRALLLAHYLGEWVNPILTAPESHSPLVLLAAAYGFTLRFYFDFAGYSDIAIGLAAVYGYEIQENFDNPLMRRNLSGLWQHWHMTLTAWMRMYLFTPLSRAIMRRGGPQWDTWAIIAGQAWAMLFCGLWHGLQWEFALWGFCHALGLIWIGLGARRCGQLLPQPFVRWWRRSPVGHVASWFLTVTAFSLINIIAVADVSTTARFFTHLAGLR
jgi:alginate O-acetyltransferase complex protein AlgI